MAFSLWVRHGFLNPIRPRTQLGLTTTYNWSCVFKTSSHDSYIKLFKYKGNQVFWVTQTNWLFSLIGYPKKGFNFSKTNFLALGGGGGRWVASAWVVYESIRIITFVVVVNLKNWGGSSIRHIMLTKLFFSSQPKDVLREGKYSP